MPPAQLPVSPCFWNRASICTTQFPYLLVAYVYKSTKTEMESRIPDDSTTIEETI